VSVVTVETPPRSLVTVEMTDRAFVIAESRDRAVVIAEITGRVFVVVETGDCAQGGARTPLRAGRRQTEPAHGCPPNGLQ
jgi:hypothetical protein